MLGPANTAKYICIRPPAKYISNTFEGYNPGRASNTAKYICIWPLAKYGKHVFPMPRVRGGGEGGHRQYKKVPSAIFPRFTRRESEPAGGGAARHTRGGGERGGGGGESRRVRRGETLG